MSVKKQKPDYEKIGRAMIAVAETGHDNTAKIYRISFLKGFVSGIGGVLGATIGIAVLLFLLSLLDRIPLIGTIAEVLKNTVETTN